MLDVLPGLTRYMEELTPASDALSVNATSTPT